MGAAPVLLVRRWCVLVCPGVPWCLRPGGSATGGCSQLHGHGCASLGKRGIVMPGNLKKLSSTTLWISRDYLNSLMISGPKVTDFT